MHVARVEHAQGPDGGFAVHLARPGYQVLMVAVALRIPVFECVLGPLHVMNSLELRVSAHISSSSKVQMDIRGAYRASVLDRGEVQVEDGLTLDRIDNPVLRETVIWREITVQMRGIIEGSENAREVLAPLALRSNLHVPVREQ